MIDRTRPFSENCFRCLMMLILVGMTCFRSTSADAASPPPTPYDLAQDQLTGGKPAAGIKTYYKIMVLDQPLLSLEIRKRDLAVARERIMARLRNRPDDHRAALLLVLTNRILDELPAALKGLETLRRLIPKSFLLAFIHGEILYSRGDIEQAREVFGKLPDEPQARPFRKIAEKLLGKFPRGSKPSAEDRRKLLLQKAFGHLDVLERDRAREIFEEVFARFPEDPVAPLALIDLFLEQNIPDEAQRVLSTWEGSRLPPLLSPLKEGKLRYLQGRFEEALQVLSTVLKSDPDNEYARFILAESCFQTGWMEKAAGHFQVIWESDRQNVGLMQRYALSLEHSGNPGNAVAVYEAALASNPEDPFLLVELAELCRRQGLFDRAEEAYLVLAQTSEEYREAAWESLESVRVARNTAREAMLKQSVGSGPKGPGGEQMAPGWRPPGGSVTKTRPKIDVATLKQISRMSE